MVTEMSTILIEDISHVRFSAPDLGEMGAFLRDFGLIAAGESKEALFYRGAGTAPFLHATTRGAPGFAALGLRASNVDDLHVLARAEGASVEDLEAPGGGKVVCLRDPDGRLVEVVAGQTLATPLPVTPEAARNSTGVRARLRSSVKLQPGPAAVVRLGHAVLNVSNFAVAEAWYKARFGFITSDEIEVAPGVAIGAFLRCDRGDALTDHHTLFLLQAPSGPGFNHAAFEVSDMDDLMRGHTHLKHTHRKATWGVGRHVLGSQIFDYWVDPWGHELEHWTDGDLFTTADGSHKATMQDLLAVQWGPLHPMMRADQGDKP